MVHYDPPSLDAFAPPQLCPKCGSHRTEVIGRSEDGTVITVRCNACGATSQVDVDSRNNDDVENLSELFGRSEHHVRFIVGGEMRHRLQKSSWL